VRSVNKGVQEFRSSGAQEFRSSGVQEFRSSGVQEFRSSGVQEFRSSGVQEFRSSGCGAVENCKKKAYSILWYDRSPGLSIGLLNSRTPVTPELLFYIPPSCVAMFRVACSRRRRSSLSMDKLQRRSTRR
jgi:hypothetical protein